MANLIELNNCPLCGSARSEELYRESYDTTALQNYLLSSYLVDPAELEITLLGQSYILMRCCHCSLIYQNSVPDEKLQTLLYDGWIDPDRSLEKHQKRKVDQDFISDVKRGVADGLSLLTKPASAATALDFGAGWGIASDELRELVGVCLVGEISSKRVSVLSSRGHVCINVHSVPDGSVDYIYTEQVLEHLVDVGSWIRLLRRKLATGGVLRIGVPNGAGIEQIIGRRPWLPAKPPRWSLNPVAPLEHLNCFTATAMSRVAGDFGLVQVHPDRHSAEALLRRLPAAMQASAEAWLFRAIGKKLPLVQYFRRTA